MKYSFIMCIIHIMQARAKHQIYYGYTLSKLTKAFDETVEKNIAVLGQYLADIRMCMCVCVCVHLTFHVTLSIILNKAITTWLSGFLVTY